MIRKSSKSIFFLAAVLLITLSVPLTLSDNFKEIILSMFSPIYELFVSDDQSHLKPEDLPAKEQVTAEAPTVEAIAAKVIFRSAGSWNSSLWINVGTENNQDYETPIVAKNSPVVIGDAVIGVIDYAGKKQSRVRLITDSGLVPSVRVVRGEIQQKEICENIARINHYLQQHPELFENGDDKISLNKALKKIEQKLLEQKGSWYLAKGEIQGKSSPLWRSDSHILKGVGFNYNFDDDYGPARDLRTGEALNGDKSTKTLPLVKVHDLLVTTGMDGVFPEGLKVATITKIELLHEGDYAYELEAQPVVGNLSELTWVYVMAPLGYNEKDYPSF